ncbi:MAG: DUF6588 family protein [Pelobium sp.]
MKKINFLKKIATTALCVISIPLFTIAQNGPPVTGLVNNFPSDITKLSQAYFTPLFKGYGFGMNSGWYNSAKAKNLLKFDLRIQASAAFVPTSDQTFEINNLGLSQYTQAKGNNTSPAIFSADQPGSTLSFKDDNGAELTTFDLPSSSGIKFAPSPQIQLTVGLIHDTEISIRYTPEIGTETGDFGAVQVLGFGAKHELTSLFFGKAAAIVPVDIAIGFGYNQLKYNYKLPIADQLNDRNDGKDLNQRVGVKLQGYTVDAILSKKLSVFTPFVSVGYNTSKTELNVLGDFVLETGATFTPPATTTPTYSTFTDPVKIKQTDIAGLRGSVGFSLHLLFFRLYGAYNIGEYSAATAGIGFGIGK